MDTQKSPDLIYGAGLLGSNGETTESVAGLLQDLQQLSISRIDTAGRYPGKYPGLSEQFLGDSKAAEKGFTIDTKIMFADADPSGTLSASAIAESMPNSARRLGVSKVDVLYCHFPDPATPLRETAEALNALFVKGSFKKLGLSNYSPEMLEEFLAICEEKAYVKPSVYQGQYNLLCRNIEKSLFPTLRKHNIVFNAYSPLAGGFLTGKLTKGRAEGTRLAAGNPKGAFHRPLYDRQENHDAVWRLDESVSKHGISIPDAAIRWMYYHSILEKGDGIILGGSRIEQIQDNVKGIQAGSLPDDVVQTIEEIWEGIKGVAP